MHWIKTLGTKLNGKAYPQAKIVDIDLECPEYDQEINLTLNTSEDFVRNFEELDKEGRDGWQHIQLPIKDITDPNLMFEFTLGRVI